MIQTRDTFLHFLSDNLTSVTVNGVTTPIVVKNVRRDLNAPEASDLTIDAINIKFLNTDYDIYVSKLTVSVDVIYTDELVAASVTEALFNLLKQASYTPKLDYSDPTNPVNLGYTIFWQPNIKFKPINVLLYYHYHARLILSQHQQ